MLKRKPKDIQVLRPGRQGRRRKDMGLPPLTMSRGWISQGGWRFRVALEEIKLTMIHMSEPKPPLEINRGMVVLDWTPWAREDPGRLTKLDYSIHPRVFLGQGAAVIRITDGRMEARLLAI